MHTDIPILVLAAGASRRMSGRDKLMELVDGAPLIARQASAARDATKGPVFVALPPAPHPRYAALAGLDVAALPVPDAADGMSASLRAGLAALPETAGAVMVLPADMPELTAPDLRAVAAAMQTHPEKKVWRGATEDGRPGHPVIFSAPLFPLLADLRGDTGGRDVVAAVGNGCCLVPLPGRRAVIDLDTPEAWAAWRAARD